MLVDNNLHPCWKPVTSHQHALEKHRIVMITSEHCIQSCLHFFQSKQMKKIRPATNYAQQLQQAFKMRDLTWYQLYRIGKIFYWKPPTMGFHLGTVHQAQQ